MADHNVRKISGIGDVTETNLKKYNITTVGELANAKESDVLVRGIKPLVIRAKAYIKQIDGGDEVATVAANTVNEKETISIGLSSSLPNEIQKQEEKVENTTTNTMTSPSVSKTIPPIDIKSLMRQTRGEVKQMTNVINQNTLNGRVTISTPIDLKQEIQVQKPIVEQQPVNHQQQHVKQPPDRLSEQHQAEKKHDEERYLIESHSWFETRVTIPRMLDDHSILLRPAIIYELSIEPHSRVAFLVQWVIESSATQKDDLLCSMTYSPVLISSLNPHLPLLKLDIKKQDWEMLSNRQVIENAIWEANAMKLVKEE